MPITGGQKRKKEVDQIGKEAPYPSIVTLRYTASEVPGTAEKER